MVIWAFYFLHFNWAIVIDWSKDVKSLRFIRSWFMLMPKHGFCKKSLRKDEPLTSRTLFWGYLSSILGGFAVAPIAIIKLLWLHLLHPPKSEDKYAKKSVQRVRGSSFRGDFLQNPYFRPLTHFSRTQTFLTIWWNHIWMRYYDSFSSLIFWESVFWQSW